MHKDIFQQARRGIHHYLLKRISTCKEIVPVLSQSMDRRVTTPERVRMWLHMLLCKWCRDYLYQIRLIRDLTHAAEAAFLDHGKMLPEVAASRLKLRLRIAKVQKIAPDRMR